MSLNFALLDDNVSTAFERSRWRGGMYMLSKFLKRYSEISEISTMLEFGIGGGGKQILWADFMAEVPDSISIGVEIFSPLTEFPEGMHDDNFQWHMKGYECSTGQFAKYQGKIFPFYGYNTYSEKTVDTIKDFLGDRLIDIIIDDSDANTAIKHPDKYDLSKLWSPLLKENGFIWSETINGQGTPGAQNLPIEEHRRVHEEFAELGWVIMDSTKFSNPTKLRSREIPTNSFMALYAEDHSVYSDVYEKFEDCIISGKYNI